MAFTYKNINSRDMHLYVLSQLEFSSPERDVESVSIPGRDGDLMMDNGRYKSVIHKIPCHLKVAIDDDLEGALSRIHQWLVADAGSHDLLFDHDLDFIYRASIDNAVTTSRILSHFGRVVINFRIHPVKYLQKSLVESKVLNGVNVENPFQVIAKPILRIVGNGDITINIGGKSLVLRGIASGCIIDSETQTITSLDRRVTLFERMYSPFPELQAGRNMITFSRNDIQVYITPRLGALV